MKKYFAVITCCAIAFGALFMHTSSASAQEQKSIQQEVGLFSPILVGVPTENSAILSIVNAQLALKGDLRYRKSGTEAWNKIPLEIPANDLHNLSTGAKKIKLTGLEPATRYEFDIVVNGKTVEVSEGEFITRRIEKGPFTFGIMTDAHINPNNPERARVLRAAADTLAQHKPDFVMHLGDNIQTIGSTHGGCAVQPNYPNIFYIYFRQCFGLLQAQSSHFLLNGNWEGENGWHPATNRVWASDARKLFAPAPDDKTFPQGGSKNQDYFAFTWGDALFVSLNATGYNTINHEYINGVGKADDWTLGKEQYAWLEKTLAESDATWKFLFIHHAVGGKAGTDVDSRYGRGGGQAAYIGEQAKVHAMMLKYGVEVFFYGHDHVFTDMQVDGINYICSGSVGAPWKFGTEETGYKTYIPDSGFVLVTLDEDKAVVQYLAAHHARPKGKELYRTEIKPR